MNISFHRWGREVLAIPCGRRTGALNDSVRRLTKLLVSAGVAFISESSPDDTPGQSTVFCSLQLGAHCLEKPSFELEHAPAKRQCFYQRDQFGRSFLL